MKKRIVAFAARVSCLPTDNERDCRLKKSEENAFLNRSHKKTPEVYQYSNGWDIINILINNNEPEINEIVIHDHGFRGGIIGDGDGTGMYTEDYLIERSFSTQATAGAFAYRVFGGLIKLANSCSIVTYGCNVSWFAKELSSRLGSVNRVDISVTGADNSVYELNGRAYVDGNSKGINNMYSKGKQNPGHFWTYKNGIVVGTPKTSLSYR